MPIRWIDAREAMAPRLGWSPEGILCEDRRRETACCSVRDSPETPLTPRAEWWRLANACGCVGSSPPARSALRLSWLRLAARVHAQAAHQANGIRSGGISAPHLTTRRAGGQPRTALASHRYRRFRLSGLST